MNNWKNYLPICYVSSWRVIDLQPISNDPISAQFRGLTILPQYVKTTIRKMKKCFRIYSGNWTFHLNFVIKIFDVNVNNNVLHFRPVTQIIKQTCQNRMHYEILVYFSLVDKSSPFLCWIDIILTFKADSIFISFRKFYLYLLSRYWHYLCSRQDASILIRHTRTLKIKQAKIAEDVKQKTIQNSSCLYQVPNSL